jgi:hypothetical protein
MSMTLDYLKARLAALLSDEHGAVTVDWVVLTAAVAGLAMIIVNMLAPALFENGGLAIARDVATAASR